MTETPSTALLTHSLLVELQSPAGEALIEAAAPWLDDPLRGIEALRRLAPEALACAAYEQAVLRKRAGAKFSRAPRMFFTRELLEQASGELAAGWRAGRFAGREWVA